MDHNRKIPGNSPAHLAPEIFFLLPDKRLIPVKVQSDFANGYACVTPAGNKLVWRRMLLQRHFDLLQLLPETRFYRTRMQAQHGKTVLRVLSAKRQHGRYGIRVNIGKKYTFNSMTEGKFHRSLPVLTE